MSVQELRHVRRSLPGGGQVVILETGALIRADEAAMLQALHSRSVGGIDAHLVQLAKTGAGKFMSMYYVGYGHKSIGDCGTVTIFIEGVSMLVAKAIQDSRLYNGQESSTRYIDFAKQRFVDPTNSDLGNTILEEWRAFYLAGVEEMRGVLLRAYPQNEGEKDDDYKRAVNARTFDIMRAFLPAGASTNLAWHTEIRHASDHLVRLRHHPLIEVRTVAHVIEDALCEAYPDSFSDKRYEATETYVDQYMKGAYYFFTDDYAQPDLVVLRDSVDRKLLAENAGLFRDRPVLTELPGFLGECGTLQLGYRIDFGSFRDLQRHRSVIQRMPLLTAHYGFGKWYRSVLTDALDQKAQKLLRKQLHRICELSVSREVQQYYMPMGMEVACRVTGDLPALVYIAERRARPDVHPTARKIAQQKGAVLLQRFGELGLTVHMDMTPDRFYRERGKQTILQKGEE